MVDYATMSTYTNQIANGKYSSQLAKLQAFQNILTIDYKWSHREMKQLLIDIIETFDSINGSGSAGSAGFDIDNPNSWKDHNSSSDNNNGGTGSGGSGSSGGGNVDAITEEKILELLKKHADQISPTIDVEKIVKTTQEEIINSKLFKDLVSQLVGNGINGLTRAIEEEEHARVSGDAQVLKQAAEKVAKEAADRVDAIANEAAVRARLLANEAEERNRQISEESRARLEGDEAEIRARNEALDAESKKRQKELQELDKSLKQRIDDATNSSGSTLEAKLKKELASEVDTVTKAIKASAEKSQKDLLSKANELGTEISTISEKTEQNALKIDTVTAKSNEALSGIEEEKRARIEADSAESLARTTLASTLRNEISAGINEERKTRVSENEARAIVNRNLTTRIGDVENSITEETKSRTTADEALGSRITEISSKFDTSEAKIQSLEQTIATENKALSKKIDSVNAKVGEVVDGKVTVQVEASIDEFKRAQAEIDKSQTEELKAAKSRIGVNETNITNLKTTTATKTEVVSIARNALSSEWRGEASKAKMEALTEAERIASEKANAAKNAADVAAQAKADAAKAQAIAESSNDATAKANAAKAQAIADAAEKDAVLKREAVEDAQRKADAAKNDAIEEARRLNNATNADITLLRRTVSDNSHAIVEDKKELVAKFNNLSIGGRNYALLTGTAEKVLTSSGTNQTKNVTIDVSPALELKQNDNLVISCDIDITNATSPYNKPYPRIGVEFSVTYVDNTIGYFAVWYDEAISGTTKTLKQRIVAKHTVAKEVKSLRTIIVQLRYQTSDSIKISNVKLERGTVPTDWTPAPEDDISKFVDAEAKITEAKTAVTDAERALTEKIDLAKSSFNSNLTEIEKKQRTLSEKDSAFASQLETLTSRVNNNESAIRNEENARTTKDSSLAEKLNELTAKYNQADAAIKREEKARADADSATTLSTNNLTSRLGTAEGKIKKEETTRAEADKSLSSKIEELSSDYKNSKAQLKTLKDTYATDNEAKAEKLSTLESNVRDNKSKLSTLETSLTTKESALAQRIDSLNAEVGKNKAEIAKESKAIADEKKAQAIENKTLKTRIGDAEGAIVSEREARTKADESVNKTLEGLVSRVGNAEGRITREEETRAREDGAFTKALEKLTSNFNQANSTITKLQETSAKQNEANAREISTLSAKLGDMRIGGRNYLRETGNLLDTTMWRFAKDYRQTQAEVARQRDILTLTAATAHWTVYSQRGMDNPLINFDSEEVITVSFEAHSSVTTRDFIQFSFRQHYRDGQTNVVKRFTPTEANKWLKYSYTFVTPVKNANFVQFEAIFEIGQVGTVKFRKLKIERGNVATDWTEASEDMTRLNESTAAELNAYKNAQTTKENANTEKLDSAISRIGTAEGKISNLETTRANKNEVASLARSTLKAEWDKAISDAKNALSSEIIETKKVATRANNTANALYSLKVQTAANGKRTVAGLMLGSNEVEGQFGVVADTFYVTSGNFSKTPFVVKNNDIFFNGKVHFASEKNLIPNPRFAVADDGVVAGVGRNSVTSHVLGGYTTSFMSHKGLGGDDFTGIGADGVSESIVKTTFHSTGANQSWWFDTTEFVFDNKDGIPGRKYTFSALANAYRATCSLLVEEMHPVNKLQFVNALGKSEEIGIGSSKANAPTDGPNFRRGIESAKTGRRLWCEFTWPAEGAVRISIRGNNIKADRPDIFSARWKLVEGTGEESRKWLADTGTMIDGSTIVSGTINGSHIKAKSIISAPYIIGGSLNIADRFKVMSNGDVLIQAAAGNTGMKITSERIDVYDTSGRLRVRMGKLT